MLFKPVYHIISALTKEHTPLYGINGFCDPGNNYKYRLREHNTVRNEICTQFTECVQRGMCGIWEIAGVFEHRYALQYY